MTDLVTTAEARIHLRTDTADDTWLAIFIPAISDAVLRWLKEDWRAYVPEFDADGNPVVDSAGDEVPAVDSAGDYTVKPAVKAAVLIELAWQFRFREGPGEHEHTATGDLYSGRYGYILSRGATALLHSVRKSTIA